MQITINVRDGATAKEIAAQFRFQAGLFEGMDPKAAASNENTLTSAPSKETTSKAKAALKETTKKTESKKAASFDDDDEVQTTQNFEDEDESIDDDATVENANGAAASDSFDEENDEDFIEEKKPAKTAKAQPKVKKFTVSDVNEACKAKAQTTDRKTVLGLLKKHFKVTSITELDQSQYGDVIKLMRG